MFFSPMARAIALNHQFKKLGSFKKVASTRSLNAQQVGALAASSNALVQGDGRLIVAKLGNAATDIEGAARDLRTMMSRLEGPTSDFATTGLQQITSASASLQQAAASFDRVLGEMQQSPQGLLAKPPAQEIEVKP